MAQTISVNELNLHREPQIAEEERVAALVTLTKLAERHGALDELDELSAMLGIAE